MIARTARLGGPLLLALALTEARAAPALHVVGPTVTVIDAAAPFCGGPAIPDAPARAWRDAGGVAHLIAAEPSNRALVGPDLHHLVPDCVSRFRGSEDAAPAALDDRAWLAAVWTEDGTRVEALAHVEYQGHRHPGHCPAGSYRACWRNGVVALSSDDGGRRFTREAVAAALPYPYATTLGAPSGYFAPSNIVAESDTGLAAFVFAEAAGAQARGPCLLRRERGEAEARWLATDAAGATAALDGVAHPRLCQPVPGIGGTVTSLVRWRGDRSWIALVAGRRRGADGASRTGIWYLTSPDLAHWGPARLLLETPVMFDHGCGDATAFAYPSLIDADAPGYNFDTVGAAAELWLVRFHLTGCRLQRARDLVRLSVRIDDG